MAVTEINSAQNMQMDYLKLLVTQLQNQNPLEPMDNQEMAMQLAQFSQLELLEKMSVTFQKVLQATDRSQAATLIGKRVTFLAPGAFNESAGRVSGVEIIKDEARLRIGSVLQYMANDMAAKGDTRVDQLDQTEDLSPEDSVLVYGVRPDGTSLGVDGQGVGIALGEGVVDIVDGEPVDRYITLDTLLASITQAFRSAEGKETYTADLVDGEIRLIDQQKNQVYGVMSMHYQSEGEGRFELPQQLSYMPSMGELTSIAGD